MLDSPPPILQANPKAGFLAAEPAIMQAIAEVLHSGWYINGQAVQQFEAEFSQFCQSQAAVAVASGTDALELAVRSLKLEGKLVFTVSHTAVATVVAIERAGAIPVLVDVDPKTYTMCPYSLKAAFDKAQAGQYHQASGKQSGSHQASGKQSGSHQASGKQSGSHQAGGKHTGHYAPGAILPVHLYGLAADLDALKAATQNLPLIEDCAQAHGAEYKGKAVGSIGQLGAFSFYPTKNLGCYGDGGAITTQDPDLAKELRYYREYGWTKRYISTFKGINSRLDELQAAILRILLKSLAKRNQARQNIAKAYNTGLANLPKLTLPYTPDYSSHVYHLYVVQHPKRQALQQALQAQGIGTGIHYPVPVHQQAAYTNCLQSPTGLPHTEALANQILSLPMYPELEPKQVDRIIQAVQTSIAELSHE